MHCIGKSLPLQRPLGWMYGLEAFHWLDVLVGKSPHGSMTDVVKIVTTPHALITDVVKIVTARMAQEQVL